MPFLKEADQFKRDKKNHKGNLTNIKTGELKKVSSIISNNIKGYDVNEISLVRWYLLFNRELKRLFKENKSIYP